MASRRDNPLAMRGCADICIKVQGHICVVTQPLSAAEGRIVVRAEMPEDDDDDDDDCWLTDQGPHLLAHPNTCDRDSRKSNHE